MRVILRVMDEVSINKEGMYMVQIELAAAMRSLHVSTTSTSARSQRLHMSSKQVIMACMIVEGVRHHASSLDRLSQRVRRDRDSMRKREPKENFNSRKISLIWQPQAY